MTVHGTDVTIESVRAIGTLVAAYIEIVYDQGTAIRPQFQLVDAEGRQLLWAAGTGLGDGIVSYVRPVNWPDSELGETRYLQVWGYETMAQPPEIVRIACVLPVFEDWIQTFYASYGHLPAMAVTARPGSWETVEIPLTPE